ncbi:MAG TPA: YdeI/OmpD-associated family protein [Bacteroidota bacterium]|nr:YdeI/OmpD-associated family protein [Bacteroidota bacterium]
MNIGKTLYVHTRRAWRSWLAGHHWTEKEIWLVYYKKNSGKPRIPYNDAVEEALCYGWIDSILKPIDKDKYAQRFTPRKPGAQWSAMNIERLRRLIRKRKMTRAGLKAAASVLDPIRAKPTKRESSKAKFPTDILKQLQKDPATWKNFTHFPASYKRIRIGWIDASRHRPEVFTQRLRYFLKMTRQNKRFGMVQ